jgi:hypothetical protein
MLISLLTSLLAMGRTTLLCHLYEDFFVKFLGEILPKQDSSIHNQIALFVGNYSTREDETYLCRF